MMKNFLIFVIALSQFLPSDAKGQKGIDFLPEKEYDSTKLSTKHIYLDFYTDWCAPCKKMEKEVFLNDEVAAFFNKNFVSYKINAESPIGIELAKMYNVNAYPTSIFLDKGQKVISKKIGYINKEAFMKHGEVVLVNGLPIKYLESNNDSLYKEILRLDALELENKHLVNTLFNTIDNNDLEKSHFLDLLFSKVSTLTSENLGYIYFIKHLDQFRRDTIRNTTLLFPSDLINKQLKSKSYDSKLQSSLKKPLIEALKLAKEKKDSVLFETTSTSRQMLQEKFGPLTVFQKRGIISEKVKFYLSIHSPEKLSKLTYEFKELLLNDQSPESIVVINQETYNKVKEKILQTNPTRVFSKEEEKILNSTFSIYLDQLDTLLLSLNRINAPTETINETNLFKEKLLALQN